jgi:hypothetical protein
MVPRIAGTVFLLLSWSNPFMVMFCPLLGIVGGRAMNATRV